jgi:hypothetical protein
MAKELTGILFVLKTGITWEYLPAEMGGGRQGLRLPSPPSGSAHAPHHPPHQLGCALISLRFLG